MVTKELPGGEIYEENGGSYANEETARRHEAIHRQIIAGGPSVAAAEAAAARAEAAASSLSGALARIAALEQDTGNVKITSASVKSATPHPTISTLRRRGRLVTLALGWKDGPVGSAVIMSLPTWARPSTSIMTKSTLGAEMFIRSGASNDVYGYLLQGTTSMQYMDASWYTDEPFPAGPYTA